MLTDVAEAALEHLIDANPGNDTLVEHLAILQSARSHGIGPTYAEMRHSRYVAALVDLLIGWIATPTWPESKDFVAEYADELLAGDAGAVLESLAAANPARPELDLYLGLLEICRLDGVADAFGLIEDPETLGKPVLELPAAAGDGRFLALARLRAGLSPDDGDAHLGHALAALAAGRHDEADRATGRSAAASASWERVAHLRLLDGLADTRADLAGGLLRLRNMVGAPPPTE